MSEEAELKIGPVHDYLQSVHSMFSASKFHGVLEQCMEQCIVQQLGNTSCTLCTSAMTVSQGSSTGYKISDVLVVNIGLVDGQNMHQPPVTVPRSMQVYDSNYVSSAAVQMEPGHFLAICKNGNEYLVIDDMREEVSRFPTFAGAVNRDATLLQQSAVLHPWPGSGMKRGVHLLVFCENKCLCKNCSNSGCSTVLIAQQSTEGCTFM